MKKNSAVLSTLSKLDQLNPKYRYCVFGGVLIFILLITYFVFTRPQVEQLKKITPQIKTLSDDLQKAKANIQQRAHYETRLEALKDSIQKIKVGVLTREDVPLILEQISQLAAKNRVKINQLMPRPEEEKSLLAYDQLNYFVLPIFMEARAGYHDFGRFLNALEKENLSFKIQELSIISIEGSLNHAIKLTLQSILVEEIQVQPAEASGEEKTNSDQKDSKKKSPVKKATKPKKKK